MIKEDKRILLHMQDAVSEKIYKYRIAYGNGSQEAIGKIIETAQSGGVRLIEFMERHRSHLYIFGAGILGKEFLRTWMWKYSFRGLIDNDEKKQGGSIEGIPVIGLKDITETDKKEAAVIIVNKFSSNEIALQLRQEKFSGENIFDFASYYLRLNREQYFDLEAFRKDSRERFADCGALDGKTSLYFYEWYRDSADKIWLFEPDKYSVEKCRQNMRDIGFHNYEIFENAVYSSKTELHFDSAGNGMSSISAKGDTIVNAISLDEAIGEESPSFIKMDIEGAELEALKGAKNIIQKYAPKLAVCVYHKPEDMEEIPQLLLEYNPNYRFYLRHYSLTMNETVLYAL